MSQITRSALVPYNAKQMYALVNDVLRYPEFLPWCQQSTIVKQGENWMEAELSVQKGAFKQAFTTRNVGVPGESIQMNLANNSGAFKKLTGQWLFIALGKDSCKIEFSLELELGASSLGFILKPLFNSIATTMVDAFSKRAKVIYGDPHE